MSRTPSEPNTSLIPPSEPPLGKANYDPAVTIDPGRHQDWERLIAARDSSVFHSSQWIRAVTATYGFDVKARVLMGDSGPIAGISYATVEGLNGLRVASFPFSDFIDPIASSSGEWNALCSGLLEMGVPLTIRCLRNPIPLNDKRFELMNRARWHAIDLRPEEDAKWEQLAPAARRAIRRSREARVDIDHAQTAEELRAFYELHLKLRKHKYRLLAQPFAFFENLWREFIAADTGTLLLARVNGEIVAGIMFLEWKDTLYYKFNASDPAFSECRPNDGLLWAGIEHGQKRGLRLLDLGLSDWDQEGLVRYKRKYATEERTISFLSHVPDDSSTELSSLGKLMPSLTELLTDDRVPDEVTEQAGSRLYRYFA